MRALLDWPATIVFLPLFVLVLLVFEPIQRVAKACGKRAHDYAVSCLCSALVAAFRVTGLRLRVERAPGVAPATPYLIIANHQSMFDIALLGHLFFRNFPKFVSKRELARRIPSVSYNLRRGGNAVIDRDDAGQAVAAIEALGARVERNRVSAVIFPEGTRSRHGELGAFKPRGALTLLAAAPRTAVVPVAIDDSWRLLRRNLLPVPFGVRVRVRIGAPISRRPGEDPRRVLAHAREEIAAALSTMREDRQRRAAAAG
jgi:1-acyl-sn-glycerol-3-phosphate acyltransferase